MKCQTSNLLKQELFVLKTINELNIIHNVISEDARTKRRQIAKKLSVIISISACIANGTIYGPGSAMDSSSLCEYCYCLAGKQQCVNPKCLLPLEGCTPIYETHSCCPVKYNCSKTAWHTTSTTTALPSVEADSRGKGIKKLDHIAMT